MFAIAGGGTGGHISPAIGIALKLGPLSGGEAAFHFVATPRPVDERMYSPWRDRTTVLDPPRVDTGVAGLLSVPFRSVSTLLSARRLLKSLSCEAVLATGGYSSFFCAMAGRSLGLRVLLHESNAVPGRANRAAARFADTVLTGFEASARWFGRKAVRVGNPVRESLVRLERDSSVRSLGLDPARPVVLFLGGSQGARAVNSLAMGGHDGLQVVLQCGERDLERCRALTAGESGIHLTAFADDPSILYSAADLCVARAGAMTLAELCFFRLPSVLVPYPHAADDHQTANAAEAAAAGGAVVMPEAGLSAETLWDGVRRLVGDRGALRRMSDGIAGLFPADSAERAARLLLGEGAAS